MGFCVFGHVSCFWTPTCTCTSQLRGGENPAILPKDAQPPLSPLIKQAENIQVSFMTNCLSAHVHSDRGISPDFRRKLEAFSHGLHPYIVHNPLILVYQVNSLGGLSTPEKGWILGSIVPGRFYFLLYKASGSKKYNFTN